MRKLIIVLIIASSILLGQGANHSATLTWLWSQGASDPATGFHVQRSQVSGGPYTIVGTVGSPTTLTFVDSSVVAGQTYFYIVTAFNTGGDSVPSNQVTCTIPFQAPAAPSGLSVVAK
jgi:hypothetical protein